MGDEKNVQVMFRTTPENKQKLKTLAALRSQTLEKMVMELVEREFEQGGWSILQHPGNKGK